MAWNALGTVETVTTVAGHVGGTTMDKTLNYFYGAYGVGAAPFDLRMVRVNNSSVASNSATYLRATPDTSGAIQVSAATGQIANIDTAADGSGGMGSTYLDTSTPLLNIFYLTSNSRADRQGTWSACEFPQTPNGAPIAQPAANQVAVAMTYTAGVAKPVMIALDTNATTKGLYAARLDDLNCSWSTLRTLDGLTGAAAGGSSTATAFTTSGKIGVVMYDLNTTRLKYYSSTDGDTSIGQRKLSRLELGFLALQLAPSNC